MVSIIIINYNTFGLTYQCIRSIIEHTRNIPYEIILVDNASTECDAELFRQYFSEIILIKNQENSGFAKGNNLGIAHASGDYILLLNSDTYLTEDSISACAEILMKQKEIGVIGCRMTYPDGRLQYSARRFRSISWELLDLIRIIPYLLPYKKRAKLMLGKYFKGDFSTSCDWVNGAFFMFPRAVLNYLPGRKLDERFFMYGEDQLWCEQIKEAGFSAYFLHTTTIVHIHSGSTNVRKQLQLRKIMARNELAIMERRKGRGIYYYCFAFIFLLKQNLLYAVKRVRQMVQAKI